MTPVFANLLSRILSASPLWLAVWLGLTALTVALLALMRTRWGQSRPMHKCAVLSLLAHVLLACVATTVKIVSAPNERGTRTTVRLGALTEDPPTTDLKPHQPWDPKPSGPVVAPPAPPLERMDQRAAEPPPSPSLPGLEAAESHLLQASQAPKLPPSEEATMDRVASEAAPLPEAGLPREDSASDATNWLSQVSNARATQEASADSHSSERADRAGQSSDEAAGEPAAKPPSTTPADSELAVPAKSNDLWEPRREATNEDESTQVDVAVARRGQLLPIQPATASPSPLRQSSLAGIPAVYRSRTSDRRAVAVAQGGGSEHTEAAVDHALTWLAKAQSEDGHWDADLYSAGRERRVLGHDRRGAGMRADAGISGLAILAMLGHGTTHLDGAHRHTVQSGLDYLVGGQRSDGNLAQNATLYASMYCHAMALLAISEAYAMTGDQRLRGAVERGVAYSISAQDHHSGGWRYLPGDPGDTSQHGWQVMAMCSAAQAGVSLPDSVWSGAARFLDQVRSGAQGGLAAYRPGRPVSPTMTAEAMYCRTLLARTRRRAPSRQASAEAKEYLLQNLPGRGQLNLYYWYYATLFLHHTRAENDSASRAWEAWNEALKPALLDSQVRHGPSTGSWNPDTVWGGYGGRVYSTAMAALCLEVYYRYQPELIAEQTPPLRR